MKKGNITFNGYTDAINRVGNMTESLDSFYIDDDDYTGYTVDQGNLHDDFLMIN